MGSVSVSSCRCCMFDELESILRQFSMLPFCMTCSLLMQFEDAICVHTVEAYSRSVLHNCWIGSHECLLLFTPSCCSECFYDL